MTLVELQLTPDKVISVNMDRVHTIKESNRAEGYTTLSFGAGDWVDDLQVFESYESVMAKVRARQ